MRSPSRHEIALASHIVRQRRLRLRRSTLARAGMCAVARGVVALYFAGMGMGGALLLAFGGGAFVPRLVGSFEVFVMLLSIAPGIFLCYLFADALPSYLALDAMFVLPRSACRASWAVRRALQLVLLVVSYEAFSAIAVMFALMAPPTLSMGMSSLFAASDALSAGSLALALGQSMLLDGAMLTVLVLWINVVALHRDAVVGFVALMGAHVGVLLAVAAVPAETAQTVAPWLLSIRGLPAWHESVCVLCGNETDFAARMSPAISFLLLMVVVLAAFVVLARTLRRIDIF